MMRTDVLDTLLFFAVAHIGKELMELHLSYEDAPEYPLDFLWTPGVPRSWHVEKMRLSQDRTVLIVNPSLTLADIPPKCFEYQLGNRSALEWVIDQYQVSSDQRSGMVSDPNQADDPKYIVRLVGQVIHVSMETLWRQEQLIRLTVPQNWT